MLRMLKKTLSLSLAVLLALAVCLPVAAAEDTTLDKSMETALIAIKSLVEIDDEVYTRFNYSSDYSDYRTQSGLKWYFSWSDNEWNKNMSANVTAEGRVISFSKYEYPSKYFGFAEVSKNEAVEIARAFIKKADPDAAAYYKAPSNVSVNLYNSNYDFAFYAEVNGHAFNAAQIYVSVNKFTGEVTWYNAAGVDPSDFKFESAGKIISEGEAVKQYAKKIGLKLEYFSSYDYNEKKLNIFPAYQLSLTDGKYISALTGDVVTYQADYGNNGIIQAYNTSTPMMAAQDSAGGAMREAELSPAEKAAIEDVKGYITKEQAAQKLLEAADLKGLKLESFNDVNVNLMKDYYGEKQYYYDFRYYKYNGTDADEVMYLNGRVDAVTGKVMSFSYDYLVSGYYYGESAVERKFSEEKAAAAVEKLVTKLAPDEFKKVKQDETRYANMEYYQNRDSFSYSRYENGIRFGGNGISASFDPVRGRVTSYSLNWNNDAVFPSIKGVLTAEQAMAEFVEDNGSNVSYITVGGGEAKLVYDFIKWANIDPFTGAELDYSGSPVVNYTYEPDYSDVEGHWSENIVEKLVENGVYAWSGKFEPDKEMSKLEFTQYLSLVESSYVIPVEYYIGKGQTFETNADAEKILTKQEAAKIIAEQLNYGKLAEKSEFFVYPFKDSVNSKYKGYITVCYMLGIIDGSNGNFGATENVTRAQAAKMIYNLILARIAENANVK